MRILVHKSSLEFLFVLKDLLMIEGYEKRENPSDDETHTIKTDVFQLKSRPTNQLTQAQTSCFTQTYRGL